jgi:hypothetical protein
VKEERVNPFLLSANVGKQAATNEPHAGRRFAA